MADEPQYSRRGVLGTVAALGTVSTVGTLTVERFTDYTVDDVSLGSVGYIVEASASESGGLGLLPLIPNNAPLTLSCWVTPAAYEEHPEWRLQSVGPSCEVHEHRLLSNPSPSELLREERFYRLETAQSPGYHAIQLVDTNSGVVEVATVTIKKKS